MKKFFVLAIALFLVSFGLSNQASGMSGDADKPVTVKTFVDMAKKALPAVVSIEVTSSTQIQPEERQSEAPIDPRERDFQFPPFGGPGQSPFDGPEGPEQPRGGVGSGSGFIISADGHIVTNNHVIKGAADIKVFIGKQSYAAKMIGADPETDVALIKIEGVFPAFLQMGDSDKLEVGEPVMAIGSPFGLNASVTTGVVSGKGRRGVSGEMFDDFVQTDASINPGNSGGPLINTNGEVIGVNSIIIGGSGIGFAISINTVKAVLPGLKEKGSVTRGWLGIVFQAVTPEFMKMLKLETDSGAVVKETVKDGPAEKAGIKREDVILSFNGTVVASLEDLPKLVASVRPGTSVPVEIWRNSKKETISVTIEKRDPSLSKKQSRQDPRHRGPRR